MILCSVISTVLGSKMLSSFIHWEYWIGINVTHYFYYYLSWNCAYNCLCTRETGEVYHKMITWQDLRASEAVASWNSSYTLKALNKSAKLLHFFTRRNRHKAASVLKFMSKQVCYAFIISCFYSCRTLFLVNFIIMSLVGYSSDVFPGQIRFV